MSVLYLFRHGQAGTRHEYDTLSDLGRRQSRLLGEYLLRERIEFQSVYSGEMSRQRQTATAVAEAFRDAAAPFPAPRVTAAWNEFDMDRVYTEIAPVLAAADDAFRREYEMLKQEIRAQRGSPEAGVHRRWSPCDVQVVDAWIRSLYPYSGESWKDFRARIAGARSSINGAQGNIAIFTSATPAAVCAGLALDIHDARVLSLAGVLYNASITVLRLRGEQLRLFSFNGTPHLPEAALRTHR